MKDLTEIVQRAKAGDQQAFAELDGIFRPKVIQLARGHKASSHIAEDLAQEILAKAFAKLNQFRGEATFSTWVYRIAANTLNSYYRTTQCYGDHHGVPITDDVAAIVESMPNPSTSPEDLMRYRELTVLVSTALKSMSLILAQAFLANLTYSGQKESATMLDIDVEAFKIRLHRGRKVLRQELAQHYPERQGYMDRPTSGHS